MAAASFACATRGSMPRMYDLPLLSQPLLHFLRAVKIVSLKKRQSPFRKAPALAGQG